MKPKKLITILIFVNDVMLSAKFYENLFQTKPIELEENFCSFEFGESFFNIHPVDMKSPFSKGGSVGYWLVDDFNGFLEHAKNIGATLYRGPMYVEEIRRSICQIQDPFGNIIGIEGT